MRIVCVTDIHWLNTPEARDMLNEAISFANGDVDGVRADFFVDQGDRIIQQGFKSGNHYWGGFQDAQNLIGLRTIFNDLKPDIQRFHLEGNHDGALSLAMMDDILRAGLPDTRQNLIHTGHQFVDTDHVRLLMWNANIRNAAHSEEYHASPDDLRFLSHTLNTSDLPVISFNHIGLDMANIPRFIDKESDELIDFSNAFYENGEEIKDIIAGSGKLMLAFSGHIHRYKKPPPVSAMFDDARVAETQYVRLPANAKNWSKGAFAVIDVSADEVRVRVKGDFKQLGAWQGDKPEPFSIPLP